MIGNLKNYFDNLYAKDRNNMLSVDFNQSIDKIHASINNEDLEDILLAEETSDNGGIIAMTGFYYQMMVAVFYLGEAFRGDWDGMFLDHHQDIVLFNNSKKIIKFIQVKTKKVDYSEYDYKISRSWIPKLFKTAYNIRSLENYNVELEIVSNCHYSDKSKYSLLPFYSFETKVFDENNQVIKKASDYFSQDVINSIKNKLNKKKILFSQNSRTIQCTSRKNARDVWKRCLAQKTLLYFKSFKMRHITPQSLHAEIVSTIPKSLDFKENQLSQDSLDHIIAEFFKACYDPKDASVQLISGEKLNQLKRIIKKQLENSAVNVYHKSSEKIFTDYLTKLDEDYSHPKMKPDFIKEFRIFVDRFNVDIKKVLSSSDLTMMGIINMYLNYNESINVTLEESEREAHFSDLLSLLLFLKISIENDIRIDEKNRHILSVNLDKLLFLFLGNNDNFREPSEVIQGFKDLFPVLDDSEKLRIATSGGISVIISGIFDKEYSSEHTTLKKEELDFSLNPSINNSKLDDMSTNSIKDVQTPINILYAHRSDLDEINQNRNKYNSLMDMKNKIDEELKLDGIV